MAGGIWAAAAIGGRLGVVTDEARRGQRAFRRLLSLPVGAGLLPALLLLRWR